jgi:hypothetical protein
MVLQVSCQTKKTHQNFEAIDKHDYFDKKRLRNIVRIQN